MYSLPVSESWRRSSVNVALAGLWTYFAWRYAAAFTHTPTPEGLLLAVAEALVALNILLRPRAQATSRDAMAWGMSAASVVLPLLFRPGTLPGAGGQGLEVASALVIIASLLSLGRSFGIVPANRGIRTRGAYRHLRHPMYLGYLLFYAGYIVNNPTLGNLAVGIASGVTFLVRIQKEEDFLSQDPQYRDYRARVRWRLVPLIY